MPASTRRSPRNAPGQSGPARTRHLVHRPGALPTPSTGAPAGDGESRRQPPKFGGPSTTDRGREVAPPVAPTGVPRSGSAHAVSVLLVTGSGLVVEGVHELLRRECERVELSATADLSIAIDLARSVQHALIVLDIECAAAQPVEALRSIKAAAPGSRLMVVAGRRHAAWFAALIEQGLDALVAYESKAAAFALALNQTLRGIPYLDPAVQLQLIRTLGAPEPPAPRLTPRELQVLKLVARGNPNKEIGRTLGLTEGTVKTYLRRLRKRLGARDRTHAAIHALTLGLVEPGRD